MRHTTRVPGASALLLLTVGCLLAINPTAAESADANNVNIVPRVGPTESAARLPHADIRVDTNLVLIPVTVTDSLGRVVTGLDRDAFMVYEDNAEQNLVSFGVEDAPLSIGIVFDTSASMGAKLVRSRAAVTEFFRTANPEDEAFLVEFNSHPELTVPFTHDLENIQDRLMFAQSKGSTSLLDAVYLALQTMKKAANPRKALLVISDGGDNNSRYTTKEILNLVRETDVQIYGIGIYASGSAFGGTAEEAVGPLLLSAIADPTGGRHFIVDQFDELPDVAARIGAELHNQYLLGYTPSNPARDGKYRKVSVKVLEPRGCPRLYTSWRTGYYAPQ